MKVNTSKYVILIEGIEDREFNFISNLFANIIYPIEVGFKYLGFHLNPTSDVNKDWDWLISKCEAIIKDQSHYWLSKGGEVVPVKSILEAIPIF